MAVYTCLLASQPSSRDTTLTMQPSPPFPHQKSTSAHGIVSKQAEALGVVFPQPQLDSRPHPLHFLSSHISLRQELPFLCTFCSPLSFCSFSVPWFGHTRYPNVDTLGRLQKVLSKSKFWPTIIPRSAYQAPAKRRRRPCLSRSLFVRSSSSAFGGRGRGVLKRIGRFGDTIGVSGTLRRSFHHGPARILIGLARFQLR
jgi:hypothetical protein